MHSKASHRGGVWRSLILITLIAGCGLESPVDTSASIAGEDNESLLPLSTAQRPDQTLVNYGTPLSNTPPVDTGFTLINGSDITMRIDVLHAGRAYRTDFDFQPGSSINFRADCGSFGLRPAKNENTFAGMYFLAEPGNHFLCGQNVTVMMTGISGQEFLVEVVHAWPNAIRPQEGSQ